MLTGAPFLVQTGVSGVGLLPPAREPSRKYIKATKYSNTKFVTIEFFLCCTICVFLCALSAPPPANWYLNGTCP